ncbi:hypothetical protein VBH21_14015 [Enterococcus hirae]|uniref:hypothetical protein n=1 Tax=Enterococcus hirae TaxID=1354 RepID=UPI0037BE0298
MNYKIFFDEVNKIDSPNKDYSYYGSFGLSEENSSIIDSEISRIYTEIGSRNELHFNKYNAGDLKKYFRIIDMLLKQDISINIYILNNKEYISFGKELGLDITELKEYFYVKIPERLFYGIVRDTQNIDKLSIFMDESTEYTTLDVYNKVKDQMNAHALYRTKKYRVGDVKGINSESSNLVQGIDVMMGIIVFILEKSYLSPSKAMLEKSDLIYRVLIEGRNIELFRSMIKLFSWSSTRDYIEEINISERLNDFLMFMNKQDAKDKFRVHKIYIDEKIDQIPEDSRIKQLRQYLGCTSREMNRYLGFLSEIEKMIAMVI